MTDIPLTVPSVSSESVRFRRSRWELPVAVVALAVSWAIFVTKDYRVSYYWPAGVVLTVIVLTRVASAQFHRTELTATHLVIRRARRSIAVAWPRVQGFMVNDSNGSRTLQVLTDDGKQTPLVAPHQTWLGSPAAFDADHRAIGRWWIAHRGPQWQCTSSTVYEMAGEPGHGG